MIDESATAPLPSEWPELDDPELLDKIIDIIVSEGEVDREAVTPDATLETLGIASMDVMMILMGIEEKLGVYMPMDARISEAGNLSELLVAIVDAMQDSKTPADATEE